MTLLSKKISLYGIFLIIVVLISGCGAYFNTFYNAKKFYAEAEKKRIRQEKQLRKSQTSVKLTRRQRTQRRSSTIPEYRKAIEKASKVLQLYPNSKYVDDALMIIGESFYHQHEYIKAQRKFNELLTAFPNSEFAPKAKLLLGKTKVALGKYSEAENILNELLLDKRNKKYFPDARLELGDLYFQQKLYSQAVGQYEQTINKIKNRDIRAQAQIRIGECYLQLGNYAKAATAFKRVRKYKADVELRYQADLKYGFCLRKLHQYEKALDVYSQMLKLTLTNYEIGNVYLQSALTMEEMKDYKHAREAFQNVIDNYPRTAASAEAYYRMGLYELNKNRDFDQALEYFQKSEKEYSRADFIKDVKKEIESIKKLHKLEDIIWALEDAYVRKLNNEYDESDSLLILSEADSARIDSVRLDSLRIRARRDSIKADSLRALKGIERGSYEDSLFTQQLREKKAREDSVRKAKLKAMERSIKIPKDPEEIKKMLVQKDFQLAELYYFQFSMTDSALKEYNNLIVNFPDDPGVPKALFSMAYIYRQDRKDTTRSDSLYREIVRNYPKTDYAVEARKILGLPPIEDQNLEAEALFLQAEKLNFDQKRPKEAIRKYQEVIQKFPNSVFAPKAQYAIAWIYENELVSKDQALKAYETLKENFPKTPFAVVAEKKLKAIQAAEKALLDTTKKNQSKKELSSVSARIDSSQKKTPPDTSLGQGPENRPSINNLDSFIKTGKKTTGKKSVGKQTKTVQPDSAQEKP
ncbi:MAG: tetratricopeptide repeat protein [Calditrichaeota bacterium]|nr:tetratricopeptide repeat protein [Calditrichota bacterium]